MEHPREEQRAPLEPLSGPQGGPGVPHQVRRSGFALSDHHQKLEPPQPRIPWTSSKSAHPDSWYLFGLACEKATGSFLAAPVPAANHAPLSCQFPRPRAPQARGVDRPSRALIPFEPWTREPRTPSLAHEPASRMPSSSPCLLAEIMDVDQGWVLVDEFDAL